MIDKNLKVTVTKKFEKPVTEIWNALTDKEKVKQYFYGTEVITDWQPGSSIVFKGEWDGQKYEDKGEILKVNEGKLIKYSHLSSFSGLPDEPGNYSIVSYEFDSENDSTILKVTQEGFENQKSRDDSKKGWGFVLDNLSKLLNEV